MRHFSREAAGAKDMCYSLSRGSRMMDDKLISRKFTKNCKINLCGTSEKLVLGISKKVDLRSL